VVTHQEADEGKLELSQYFFNSGKQQKIIFKQILCSKWKNNT
jgi:hypothetical protein